MSLDIYADFTEDFVGNEKIENKNNCFRNLLIKFEDTNKTYEDFISGNNWEKLRIAARDLLGETELGFYPPPKPIEFDYLVELVDYP